MLKLYRSKLESPLLGGNNLCHYKICGFKLNTDKVVETSQWVVSTFVRKDAKKAKVEKLGS
jgi:hypothetical protein